MTTRLCDVLRFIQSCDKADLATIKADVDLQLLTSSAKSADGVTLSHDEAITAQLALSAYIRHVKATTPTESQPFTDLRQCEELSAKVDEAVLLKAR